MNILKSREFYQNVGPCSSQFIIDIIHTYNIGFAVISVNVDRQDIEEICMLELEDQGYNWSSDDITVIYDIYDNTLHDSMAKCAILHIKTSELIRLFQKTKKLKAFL